MIGGRLEFGETFKAVALRELQEETGIQGFNPQIVSLSNQRRYISSGVHCVIIGVTVEVPTDSKPENREPDKCSGFKWFALDNLPGQLLEASEQILAALSGEGEIIIHIG